MTSREFGERLAARARLAGVSVPGAAQAQLEEYFRLLARWNSKVNLTSLPVRSPTNEAIDRLLIEPIVAAMHFHDSAEIWADLGSGGGSPAIPIKILRPSVRLTMVEAKGRKAAFLREAVRVLGLRETTVENARFEVLLDRIEFRHRFDVVTVRAVRADDGLFAAAQALLDNLARPARLLMFQSEEGSILSPSPTRFVTVGTFPLLHTPRSYLVCLEPVR